MNTKKIIAYSLLSAGIAAVALVAAPALAQTTTTVITAPVATRAVANIQKVIQKSDTAITQRIDRMNTLITRINSMQKLSDTEKSGLAAALQNEISELNTLKAKIDADTDAATLKTDAQSITKSYRIYALVLPQAAIAAASDRVLTIVDSMNALVAKIQARISQLPSGTDTTSMQSTMSDIASKLSDATTQANAAVSETASLTPDQGNATTAASNTAALKDARKKLQTAQQDIVAARKDFKSVVQAIRAATKPAVTNGQPENPSPATP